MFYPSTNTIYYLLVLLRIYYYWNFFILFLFCYHFENMLFFLNLLKNWDLYPINNKILKLCYQEFETTKLWEPVILLLKAITKKWTKSALPSNNLNFQQFPAVNNKDFMRTFKIPWYPPFVYILFIKQSPKQLWNSNNEGN